MFGGNQVSRWVITEIVSERNRRARVDVVSRFIDIAMEMRHLGNFNGICEITAGLTTIDVKRLKKTWTGVSSERENILRFLCDLLSRDRSYKNYRQVCGGMRGGDQAIRVAAFCGVSFPWS